MRSFRGKSGFNIHSTAIRQQKPRVEVRAAGYFFSISREDTV
jgi:hypothetical protein